MSNPRPLLIEAHYLPCLAYFGALLLAGGHLRLEAHETYQKQTARNRCYVRGPHRVERLTLPVPREAKRQNIRDVRLEDTSWGATHWRALRTAYGKSPFFEFFADGFHALYADPPQWLWEANRRFLSQCLQWLELPATVTETNAYAHAAPDTWDLRSALHPRREESWRPFFRTVPYRQVFGEMFAPNLSVVDLMCCEGPAALSLLKQSIGESV
ncbi:MAG: WbqC family protein [Catalinimonas sp.]